MVLVGEGGGRPAWAELPGRVRDAVTRVAGAPVVAAVSQPGGFSPGLAARLRLADGRRVFAKAVGAEHEVALRMHRREAEVAARLPAEVPAPRLLGFEDLGDWVALVFADVDARPPASPWRPADWARAHAAIVALAGVQAPADPRVMGREPSAFSGWRRLVVEPELAARVDPWARANLDRLAAVEGGWAEAVRGDRLAHGDLRGDNMLFTEDEVLFVDWPQAAAAAPWVDLVCLLPSLAAQGGPDPARVWASTPLAAAAEPARVDALVAAITGYFVRSALLAAPPGLRAFQAAQAGPALARLRSRLS